MATFSSDRAFLRFLSVRLTAMMKLITATGGDTKQNSVTAGAKMQSGTKKLHSDIIAQLNRQRFSEFVLPDDSFAWCLSDLLQNPRTPARTPIVVPSPGLNPTP